jgi:lipopolysaccharide/colanic/teichoic acid biosynthesis glycosyltransferase
MLVLGEEAPGVHGAASLHVVRSSLFPTLDRFTKSRTVLLLRTWVSSRLGRRASERVLMLGDGSLARAILEEVEARPQFHGIRPPRPGAPGVGGGLPACDRIVVALGERRGQLPLRELLEPWARGVVIEDGVEFYERLTGKLAIEVATPSRLVFSHDFRKHAIDGAARRVLSLLVATTGLLLTAPLLLLIAVLIKLDSKGPVLFVQRRVGAFERPFSLFKFRTMRTASRRTSEWVRDNGDRITRVGAWLRKFRLDELPQFVNVLYGDMDVVGPRPHPVSNHELLVLVARNAPLCGHTIPFYALRSLVRPGITGWAQVRYGYANDVDEEVEKLRYDLYYVKHRSLWLDLRILLETIRVILFGRGSDQIVSCAEAPRRWPAGSESVSRSS